MVLVPDNSNHTSRGMATFHVYIMASKSHRLYTGVTGFLANRVSQHKERKIGFTAKYRIDRLVYCEEFRDPRDAIRAEKIIKAWSRSKKIALIERDNPDWRDLFGFIF